jgi:lipopolysaccharide transport system ATP-binding protein
MWSDMPAINVRDVSKHYVMFDRPEHRLKQMIVPRLRRAMGLEGRRYYRNFAALEGVSFEVPRGETVGIIGRNGSGKSTLLQIICGTLNPTRGKVTVNGRIAALLELGAGFNPEFTGRENVYLNAAILGLKRAEVDERFDSIARFAEIGQFIDRAVKTYSSGMYVRLAFAVAINVDPDILVVDEALAVGDEAFRRKCYARIEEIQSKGGTILFVSHGAQTIVQLCSRAILLDGGELILQGDPKTVTGQYQRLINLTGEQATAVRAEIVEMGRSGPVAGGASAPVKAPQEPNGQAAPAEVRAPRQDGSWFDPSLVSSSTVNYESQGAWISELKIQSADGRPVNVLEIGERYRLSYEVDFTADAHNVIFGMQAKTVSGLALAGANNVHKPHAELKHVKMGERRRVAFTFTCRFMPGVFLTDVGVMATVEGEKRFAHRILDAMMFRVAPKIGTYDQGYFVLDADLEVAPVAIAGIST